MAGPILRLFNSEARGDYLLPSLMGVGGSAKFYGRREVFLNAGEEGHK